MQLLSLGRGTVSTCPHVHEGQCPLVLRCPRVLHVLPTMSDSWDCQSWDTWELSNIVRRTCNTLGLRGTRLHGVTARPSKDKARDSSFSLISLAADSLLYNAVSTIRYRFFVTLHVESIACCGNAFYMQRDKKEVLWILHCKATSRPQVK